MLAHSRLYRPRGLRLPGGRPVIDWDNPITAGLVGCWVAVGEGGAKPVIRDLVTSQLLSPIGSPVIRATSTGMAAQDLLGSNGWSGLAAPSQQPTTQFSVLWHGQAVASTVSDSINPPLLACNYDNTNTAEFSWGLVRGIGVGASPTNVRIEWGGSTTTSVNAAAILPAAAGNALVSLLGSVKSGGPVYVYRNGLLFTSNTAASFTSNYSATPTIRMGLAQDGASPSGLATKIACVWNRQLTPGESALISADPTGFLLFPTDLMYAELVGVRLVAALSARGFGGGFGRPPLIGAAAMHARGLGAAEGRALPSGKIGLSARGFGAADAKPSIAPTAKLAARALGEAQAKPSVAGAAQLAARSQGSAEAKSAIAGNAALQARAIGATASRPALRAIIPMFARAIGSSAARAAASLTAALSAKGQGSASAKAAPKGTAALSARAQGVGRARAHLSFGAIRRRMAVFFRGLRGN